MMTLPVLMVTGKAVPVVYHLISPGTILERKGQTNRRLSPYRRVDSMMPIWRRGQRLKGKPQMVS